MTSLFSDFISCHFYNGLAYSLILSQSQIHFTVPLSSTYGDQCYKTYFVVHLSAIGSGLIDL